MMSILKEVIILNKKEGETPLEALENFRKKNREYLGMPMTYAGRLDPMASGVLLVLRGEEIKNKEKYLSLSKEYDFEVLFGFDTDTFDILGLITRYNTSSRSRKSVMLRELTEKITDNLKFFRGEFWQKYPMYSSKTVNGKPLFTYARQGRKVAVPMRKVFVQKLTLKNIREIGKKNLFNNIKKRIGKVNGNFRQDEILESWRKSLASADARTFPVAKFNIKCGSGVYVRSVAENIGRLTGAGALAFSIKRTRVGNYTL